MSIATGTRFGSYEVVAQIGAGGMGEVYEARDTKLGRNVAIKVLPEAFAHDPERLSRFQREAKMLASLNHPVSHTWIQKLARDFTADPSEMWRLQIAYGDPTFAQLSRAQEYTREMKERGELRSQARKGAGEARLPLARCGLGRTAKSYPRAG